MQNSHCHFFLLKQQMRLQISTPNLHITRIGKVICTVSSMNWHWLVSQFAFYCCNKTLIKSNGGTGRRGKHLFNLYAWPPSIFREGRAGTQAGTWKQMRSQVNGDVLLTGLLSLNPYTTQDHLSRGSATTVGRALPRHSSTKKMPHRLLAYRANLMEADSHLRSPLPR